MKTINLFLVGTGLIGGTLLKQLKQQASALRNEYGKNIILCGLANSKTMLFSKEGLTAADLENNLAKAETSDISQFIAKMKAFNLPNSVFVDCTANEGIASKYAEILQAGVSVVAPNKKAASGKQTYYNELKKLSESGNPSYFYETNVGAGLPVIETLQKLILTGDKIEKIEAVLSGTLSFIFNTYDGSVSFSEVVKSANAKGYTEPDPRDDLNGMDVARKILILARETGAKMELSDVQIANLISPACEAAASVEDFFIALAKMDEEFAEKIKTAQENQQVLRFIAGFENGQAGIELKAVGQNHPFYSLSGADNIISYTTARYHDRPLVVKGPGAGAEVTAAGVFADILRVAERIS